MKDIDVVGGVFAAFGFPAVAVSQLIIEKRPSMAMGGAAAAWYFAYDGTATGLIYAYIAAGTVFAVLDRATLQQEAASAEAAAGQYAIGKLKQEENKEKAAFCKKHPTFGSMLGWC